MLAVCDGHQKGLWTVSALKQFLKGGVDLVAVLVELLQGGKHRGRTLGTKEALAFRVFGHVIEEFVQGWSGHWTGFTGEDATSREVGG